MPSVTYTALRNFEPTGYAKSGTDLSAAHADNSFNSSSTSLIGLNDNEWALVSGFATAANNGWFQANGASILHKITQDTSAVLVNESAGPAVTITGYKRGYGQSYSIDFAASGLDRTNNFKRTQHQPIGPGAPETVFWRDEVFVDVTTDLIAETDLGIWREFLGSVNSGEQFTFDRYGTAASPVEPKVAIIAVDSYRERRAWPAYPGKYTIDFKVRILN